MITFHNVNKWFGRHQVLKNINLRGDKGEVIVDNTSMTSYFYRSSTSEDKRVYGKGPAHCKCK